MAGKRVNLADLVDEPVLDAVPRATGHGPTSAPLVQVAANPLNPRASLGDLADLAASLRENGQLQPCTVVSRAGFLRCFPELEQNVAGARWVIVAGHRRRAAAELAGLPAVDVTVRENLAESRTRLMTATIAENIDREDLDPIDEARALEQLVKECGSGTAAGERLHRTKGWVSQRLSLLRLAPDMQARVRSGEIPVRDARSLAKLAGAKQLPAWQQLVDERKARPVEPAKDVAEQPRFTAVNPPGHPDPTAPPPTRRPTAGGRDLGTAAIQALGGTPDAVAALLRVHFDAPQRRRLADLLLE